MGCLKNRGLGSSKNNASIPLPNEHVSVLDAIAPDLSEEIRKDVFEHLWCEKETFRLSFRMGDDTSGMSRARTALLHVATQSSRWMVFTHFPLRHSALWVTETLLACPLVVLE